MSNGIGNRPNCCAGCCQRLNAAPVICTFATKGFAFDGGGSARPCGTRYHPGCFQLGAPFSTRLKNRQGLQFPSHIQCLGNFICEACTVRAVLQRELRHASHDLALLALERARLIDMLNSWSEGTHARYQCHLRYVATFEKEFGVAILSPTPLVCPPHSAAIPTMWAQQRYALQPSPNARRQGASLAFGTVRGIRSAVGQFYQWDWQVAYPDRAVHDGSHRAILVDQCSPTDSMAYTAMTNGFAARKGDNPQPSKALLARHVAFIDKYLDGLYRTSTDPESRLDAARAGLTNTCSWLGWFRAMELFGLEWANILVVAPGDGHRYEVPDHVGGIRFHFPLPTKTSRATDTDLWCAYTSGSGFSPGKWFQRLRRALGVSNFPTDATPVFQRRNGHMWTSAYYRTTYLIPLLEMQRQQGDPYLLPYDGATPGTRLANVFFSLHSYRDGAATHVTRHRVGCWRKATKEEVYGHGRWRLARSTEPINDQYTQPPVLDQLAITLYCM
jgi:hypothetical protein